MRPRRIRPPTRSYGRSGVDVAGTEDLPVAALTSEDEEHGPTGPGEVARCSWDCDAPWTPSSNSEPGATR